ncbi:hypothetical protein Cadr_000013111 [Camelus dromedarius]|uniref:Uncharacterized protein n=1 Tax=Camelus dromedarius TaxID=9838 RepID=A0A5N4DDA0_CAMDR|nr:hypothetical protein Cadr_000013111 [Camelus dromedarius]
MTISITSSIIITIITMTSSIITIITMTSSIITIITMITTTIITTIIITLSYGLATCSGQALTEPSGTNLTAPVDICQG